MPPPVRSKPAVIRNRKANPHGRPDVEVWQRQIPTATVADGRSPVCRGRRNTDRAIPVGANPLNQEAVREKIPCEKNDEGQQDDEAHTGKDDFALCLF
jgi:hypothetical protein